MTDAETETLRNRGVMIASKDQPCELMRITALPLQKGKVIAEMDEEEKNGVVIGKAKGCERSHVAKEKEKGKNGGKTTKMGRNKMNATEMERLFIEKFSAEEFWFSIRGKLFKGTALKRVFPPGTLFEIAKESLTKETWTLLENERKADNLIRTVPPKCPHKELFAEFILLRLLEVCDIAKTTKKGQTDKGWAQCRFEMVPIKSSGESTQIYLNVLVEAAFHRLRVAKIADGTVLNMRYDGFRSSSSQVEKKCRIELEDVNKVTLEVEKRRKMEANERLTKASPRSRKPSPSKVTNQKLRKNATSVQKRINPRPAIVIATDNESEPSLSPGPHSLSQNHSKEDDSTNCLKSSFDVGAGPGTAAAATTTAKANHLQNGGGNRIAAPSALWDLSDCDDHNKGNTRERAMPCGQDDPFFEPTRRGLADRINFSNKRRPTMETENERENSPKKPRTPADTILEPKSVKSGQDTKDNDSIDSAYQTKLRSAIELATAKTPKNIGKNVNESNLTKQFDDALELDKSTDGDDENIEEEIVETDVEEQHDPSQNRLMHELFSSEALCGRGQIRIRPLQKVHKQCDEVPVTKKSRTGMSNQRPKHRTARKMAKPYHNQRKKLPPKEKTVSLDDRNGNSLHKSSRDDVAVDALMALNGKKRDFHDAATVNDVECNTFCGGSKNTNQVVVNNDAVQHSDAEQEVQRYLLLVELHKRNFLQAASVRARTRTANKAYASNLLLAGVTVATDSNEGESLRNILEFANVSRIHMDGLKVLDQWKRAFAEMSATETQKELMSQFVYSRISGEKSWPNKEINHFDFFIRNNGEYWNLMTAEKCETIAELVAYHAYGIAMKSSPALFELQVLRSLVVESESDLRKSNIKRDIREQIRHEYNTRILSFLKIVNKDIYY